MTNKISIKFLTIAIFCMLFGVAQIFAQAGTGAITGVVKDSTGAVIPNATVKFTNSSTGFERTTTASADGIYTFTLLQPGQYRVSAGGGNFAEQTLDVQVQVGRTTDANFNLGVGDVSAVVDVSAEGIQTTEIKPDAVLSDTAITELPINGRRFQDFAVLTPGAQIDPQRGQISLSGQRGINTNVNVDGTDYNQPFFGGIRGGERSNSAFTLPQESIREFQVVASGYGAEYGRSSGGVINVVTKSGGNRLSGSAFYLNRPNQVARGNEFSDAILAQVPQNVETVLAPDQQQFGGSIGGPIIKDKLFYFGAYEQQRFRAPRQVFYGSSTDVNPANLNAGQLDVYNVFKSLEVPFTQTNDAYSGVAKIDWNFNDANRFNIRANYSRNNALNAVTTGETSVDPTVNKSLLTNGTERDRNIAVVSQLISNFSPSVVNDLRVQFAREDRPRLANSFTALLANTYGDIGTRSFLPTTQYDTRYQLSDAITFLKGNHIAKFGVELSRIFASQEFGFNQPGNFNYFNSNDLTFLNVLSNVPNLTNTNPSSRFYGRLDDATATYRLQVGNLQAAYKVYETSFYGQDTWRVTPKISFTYGLRVEKQFNPSPELGNDALINAVKNGSFPRYNGANFDPTVIPDSEWQIGPRIGLAYDPSGDGKTVIRGFAGVYYARTPLLLFADAVNNFRETPGNLTVQIGGNSSLPANFSQALFDANNPNYVARFGPGVTPNTIYRQFALLGIDLNQSPLTNLPIITPQQLAQITGALNAASTNPNPGLGIFQGAQPLSIASDFENPRSIQAGLGFERELAKNLSFGVDFSVVDTDRLQRNRDINLPAPLTANQYADLLIASNNGTVRNGAVFIDTINQIRQSGRPIYAISTPRGIPSCAIVATSCPSAARIIIPTRLRPVPNLGSVTVRESTARSVYEALTFRARYTTKRFRLNAYYVLSSSKSDDDNERSSSGFEYDDSFNLIPEYGYSKLDVRHRFTANPIVFLPYGFELSSAIRLRSGRAVDALIGNDLNGDGSSFNDRPYESTGAPFVRNSFRGNGSYEVDLRVQKSFSFNETQRLSFSAEFFNVFNNSNIEIGSLNSRYCSNTNDLLCGFNGSTNPNFLQVRDSSGNLFTSNSAGSQVFQAQFGARFQF